MNKNSIRYLIDALLFIDICSIAALGLLLAFIIPGGEFFRASKYFLGLHRHTWGHIHLYLSVFLIVLLILHLWLHWTWIVQSTKRYFGIKWKNALWCFAGAWVVVLVLAWIVARF